jgi:hypothetical protein
VGTWVFYEGFSIKPDFVPHLILSVTHYVYFLAKALKLPLFVLLLVMAYVELKVGMRDKTYLHHICYNVKDKIQGENQVLRSDQDVHLYGYDGYGKVGTWPILGASYYLFDELDE